MQSTQRLNSFINTNTTTTTTTTVTSNNNNNTNDASASPNGVKLNMMRINESLLVSKANLKSSLEAGAADNSYIYYAKLVNFDKQEHNKYRGSIDQYEKAKQRPKIPVNKKVEPFSSSASSLSSSTSSVAPLSSSSSSSSSSSPHFTSNYLKNFTNLPHQTSLAKARPSFNCNEQVLAKLLNPEPSQWTNQAQVTSSTTTTTTSSTSSSSTSSSSYHQNSTQSLSTKYIPYKFSTSQIVNDQPNSHQSSSNFTRTDNDERVDINNEPDCLYSEINDDKLFIGEANNKQDALYQDTEAKNKFRKDLIIVKSTAALKPESNATTANNNNNGVSRYFDTTLLTPLKKPPNNDSSPISVANMEFCGSHNSIVASANKSSIKSASTSYLMSKISSLTSLTKSSHHRPSLGSSGEPSPTNNHNQSLINNLASRTNRLFNRKISLNQISEQSAQLPPPAPISTSHSISYSPTFDEDHRHLFSSSSSSSASSPLTLLPRSLNPMTSSTDLSQVSNSISTETSLAPTSRRPFKKRSQSTNAKPIQASWAFNQVFLIFVVCYSNPVDKGNAAITFIEMSQKLAVLKHRTRMHFKLFHLIS